MPRNDDLLLRAEDLACWFDVSPPWLERTLSRQPEQTPVSYTHLTLPTKA